MDNTVNPQSILKSALSILEQRSTEYDKPSGERSMEATVTAFNAAAGLKLTEEQGWLFMVMLKAVRSQQGAFKMDSYEDGVNYFALAAEAAFKERT